MDFAFAKAFLARTAVGGLLFAVLSPALAQAQAPTVPRDLLQNRRAVQGDAITFCINPATLAADFNRAVAQEIAKALLSKANFHNVTPTALTQPLDYSYPISESELLVYLSDYCQVFTGFNLVSGAGPEWLTYSREYAQTGFVLATTNPAYTKLEDIPRDQGIGARFLSAADLKFLTYLQSLPEAERWRRVNLFNNKILLERLLDGRIAAALIWEPALKAGLKGNPKAEAVRIIPTGNFVPPPIRFGMALRSNDTYLRTLIDEATESLIKDGTIERLLQQYGIPGKPGELAPQSTPARNNLLPIAILVVLVGLWLRRRWLRRA